MANDSPENQAASTDAVLERAATSDSDLFFEIMEHLTAWVSAHAPRTRLVGTDDPDLAHELRRAITTVFSLWDEGKTSSGSIDGKAYKGVHLTLVGLLALNHQHLKSIVGRDEADRALQDAVHALIKRPKGQPRKVSRRITHEAKALHDSGKFTWAKIGRRYNLPARLLLSAVRNDFPKEKKSVALLSEKKSHD
jgi:hypothetical protein